VSYRARPDAASAFSKASIEKAGENIGDAESPRKRESAFEIIDGIKRVKKTE
jgi:hypothetical protein